MAAVCPGTATFALTGAIGSEDGDSTVRSTELASNGVEESCVMAKVLWVPPSRAESYAVIR